MEEDARGGLKRDGKIWKAQGGEWDSELIEMKID